MLLNEHTRVLRTRFQRFVRRESRRDELAELEVRGRSWTEPGEWLQYAVEVEEAGRFMVSVESVFDDSAGHVSLMVDGEIVVDGIGLEATGDAWAFTELGSVRLDEGTHRVLLVVEEGGFDLKSLVIELE